MKTMLIMVVASWATTGMIHAATAKVSMAAGPNGGMQGGAPQKTGPPGKGAKGLPPMLPGHSPMPNSGTKGDGEWSTTLFGFPGAKQAIVSSNPIIPYFQAPVPGTPPTPIILPFPITITPIGAKKEKKEEGRPVVIGHPEQHWAVYLVPLVSVLLCSLPLLCLAIGCAMGVAAVILSRDIAADIRKYEELGRESGENAV